MTETCDIHFDNGIFHLSNDKTSYVMELGPEGTLLHRYWGLPIPNYGGSNRTAAPKRAFASALTDSEPLFSLDSQPLGFSAPYQGDFGETSLALRRENGAPAGRFRYLGHEVQNNLHIPEGLPHIRPMESQQGKTLSIRFRDDVTGVVLTLFYTIMDGSAAIIRSAQIANEGDSPVWIDRALSALIDMPYENNELVTFHGSHMQEFQLDRRPITHGVTSVGSTRGASSPQYPAFAAICNPATTETSGLVRAVQLVYSGNHTVRVERDQYDRLRTVIGINPDEFSWKLAPGESFETPQAVLISSGDGFNGMSREYHELYTKRLFPRQWAEKTRPVLLNTWEMSYFDVSEEQMLKVIPEAASLGFELVVLDDGWFGRRNNSRSSLGDWTVNREKFPNDLYVLTDCARENGIELGIWFEPEMISPDSDLMRAHPDWAAHYPDIDPLLSRHQLVLDLTRTEVQDYVINALSDFLATYPVSYVKWDMNRHITDAGSPLLGADQSGEFFHRYILGLYRILDVVTTRFPNVLFENCSSGGGRFDPGMSFYMPQTWCSDNTDALDRQKIQYGASYAFPPSAIAAHVSTIPNHQTGRNIPFKTRAYVASSANMGYELNILDFTPEERDMVIQQLAQYKEDRDLIFCGEFYRLRSPFDSSICAWMLTDRKHERAIVYAFTPAYDVAQVDVNLKIPYLDPHRMYRDTETDAEFSGIELNRAGLAFRFDKGDYPAQRIELQAV